MRRVLVLVAIVCSLASPAVVRPQQQQQQQPSAPPPASPMLPQAPSIDTQGGTNYLLGPGDMLDVRVLFQSDMNAIVEVDTDGNITSLPFVESPIPAKCRNVKEVQKDITKAYSRLLKNPQVSVLISEKKSRLPAIVMGAVRQPTRVMMLRRVRLNEVITAAYGFTERATGTIQIVHTEPVMCPLPGEAAHADNQGPLEIIRIADLKAGKPEANPEIRPGDAVSVTEAEPVYVIGSVLYPQLVYLTDNLTLTRALAAAGGPRSEAKTTDVRITRQEQGQARQIIKVDLAAIRKNQKPDILLRPFDTIEVPEASPWSPGRIGHTLFSALTGSVPGVITNSTIIR